MNSKKRKNDWTMKKYEILLYLINELIYNEGYFFLSCWPNENQNPELQKLNRRIEHISGLHANSFKNYSEPYMCGNYGIGGHYW